jgi:hypothetical protein
MSPLGEIATLFSVSEFNHSCGDWKWDMGKEVTTRKSPILLKHGRFADLVNGR